MPEEQNTDQQDHYHHTQTAAANRLKQLYEQSRTNLSAMLAQRASSTFTLHEEPRPMEANDRALVVVYPQDPFIGEPEVRTMSRVDINPGLTNSRVIVQDDLGELAQPDEDGNYMYWPGTPQFAQVNAFYFVTFTLRMYERYARRALPWSFPSPRIIVDPHAGDEANAFYSESTRMLGFHSFVLNGRPGSTAHSADIVSHETAHAVLDSLRDLHNESFGLGPAAFHESFGDMTAMLVALHDDSLVRRLLDWTNNDLHTDNFVTQVAEQLTKALVEQSAGYMRGHTIYLRNAINNFENVPFDSLDYIPQDSVLELGRQSHNYSRLFTGAFYDIFAGIYNKIRQSDNVPGHIAIYSARNTVAYMLVTAIELGPVGEFDFTDMARAFLAADQLLYNGRNRDILQEVFVRRKLLQPDEVETYIQQQNTLPDVHLPKTINSALASALFLEQEVLPQLDMRPEVELTPLSAYRNAAGYAFLTYFSSHRMQLSGLQYGEYDGSVIDLFGGLTLGFDENNKLRSVCYRPSTAEDQRQIQITIVDLLKHGLIAQNNQTGMPYIRQTNGPLGLALSDEYGNTQHNRLVTFPVEFDRIPESVTDFVDYLHKMKTKLGFGKTDD